MKPISYEVLDLLHEIQDLAIGIENIQTYYQQNVQLFQVYILEDKEHIYNKCVYIDGCLSSYDQVIKDLKQIILDLEAMKNESGSKNKSFV